MVHSANEFNEVILVDENDNPIGTAEKLTAHQQAQLHRAFSVFIFRYHQQRYELLLQQRNPDKYHTGGLWTNTCCSHPAPKESVLQAAKRRLSEEMGIITELFPVGSFHYTASVGPGLTENEIDHVFIGKISQENFIVNAEEVANFRWIDMISLEKELQINAKQFTPWFAEALKLALTKITALNLK